MAIKITLKIQSERVLFIKHQQNYNKHSQITAINNK